jgi:hypothetical protein
MAWINADGLYQEFGTEKGAVGNGGEYRTVGPERMSEFHIDLQNLTAVEEVLVSETDILPKNVRPIRVRTIVTEIPVTGDAANWNLGTVELDATTEIDFDGLVIAADGEVGAAVGTITDYTQASTDHGADLGELTTVPGRFVAWADTGTFSAGMLRVQVFYQAPTVAQ